MAEHGAGQKTADPDKQRPTLRFHKRALWLLAFYIPLIIIPWIITLVLAYRPLTQSSYAYSPGFSYKEYKLMQAWPKAVFILNTIAAILTIPITSSLAAQAAVVFAQRRYPEQRMSVRFLFALADREWLSPKTIHSALFWDEPGRLRGFLLGVAGLVIVGAVQFPLYQLLVPWHRVSVVTCANTKYIGADGYGVGRCDFHYSMDNYERIGSDLEPAQMANIPAFSVLPRMRNELSTAQRDKVFPNMWHDPTSYLSSSRQLSDLGHRDVFVTALPWKTTTGVLREHLMRLNSTISCDPLAISDYPTTCSGVNPFQTSIELGDKWGTTTIDVCTPGEMGKYPWTKSRNRQELSEEVFIRFSADRASEFNKVIHCKAQTTRGYFELGNIHSDGVHGPLLEQWPATGPSSDFHDYFVDIFNYPDDPGPKFYFPSELDDVVAGARPVPDPIYTRGRPETYTNMSGPLMMSTLALFGKETWIQAAANLTLDVENLEGQTVAPQLLQSLCSQTPFAAFRSKLPPCSQDLADLHSEVQSQIVDWNREATTTDRFQIAMFFANQAALTSHSEGNAPWGGRQTYIGRLIYTTPGMAVLRPTISLPAQIVLNVLLGMQILGLLYLVWFIYKVPTWTRTLNALAIARVTAALDADLLPPFANTGQRELTKLAHTSGLVGVQSTGSNREFTRHDTGESEVELGEYASGVSKAATVAEAPLEVAGVVLGLGAPGLIIRRDAKWRTPKAPAVNKDPVRSVYRTV